MVKEMIFPGEDDSADNGQRTDEEKAQVMLAHCFRQAGHAVVGAMLGLELDEVSARLLPGQTFEVGMAWRGAEMKDYPRFIGVDGEARLVSPGSARDMVQMCLAGIFAGMVHLLGSEDPFYGHRDRPFKYHELRRVFWEFADSAPEVITAIDEHLMLLTLQSPAAAEEYFEAQLEAAYALVGVHFASITVVARYLFDLESLTGEDFEALLAAPL
jgi:hypothetical protein